MLVDVSASANEDPSGFASPDPAPFVLGDGERHQPPHPLPTSRSTHAAESTAQFLENGGIKPLQLRRRREILRDKILIDIEV